MAINFGPSLTQFYLHACYITHDIFPVEVPRPSQCLVILILFLCAFGVQGSKPSMSFVWMDSLICPGINISTANQIIPICSLNQTIFMGFGLLHLSRILSDPFSHSRIVHILIKPREMWCLLKIKYCPWFAWRILWMPAEHLQGNQRQLMADPG